LREIKLYVEKTSYNAGETVTGTAEVICDKDFKFNEMYVTFQAKERTWVTKQVGKHTHTYTEDYFYVDDKFEIMSPGMMQAGDIRVPFTFEIPSDAPTSYNGTQGFIEYTLEGKIEVTWSRDPVDKINLIIIGPSETLTPSSVTGSEIDDGVPQLDAELENNEIYPGDTLHVKYRVERQERMRGIRIDVETTEVVTAQGQENKNWIKYSEVFIDEKDIPRGSWRSIEIITPNTLPKTHSGPLVNLTTILKVVIDIPWGFDKSVNFPLIVRNKDTETSDIFGDYSSDDYGFQ
jgi:sporulation-control protein spo0M